MVFSLCPIIDVVNQWGGRSIAYSRSSQFKCRGVQRVVASLDNSAQASVGRVGVSHLNARRLSKSVGQG